MKIKIVTYVSNIIRKYFKITLKGMIIIVSGIILLCKRDGSLKSSNGGTPGIDVSLSGVTYQFGSK